MVESTSSSSNVHWVVDDNSNPYKSMVIDVMRMNQGYTSEYSIIDEEKMQTRPDYLIFWKILTNHCRTGAKITVNYWLLHMYSSSSQIMSLVRPVMKKSSNGRKIFYLNENMLKENFCIAKSMIKPFGLGYKKIHVSKLLHVALPWKYRFDWVQNLWSCLV